MIVLKCEPEQERLLLSFKLTNEALAEDGGEKKTSKKREVTYETGRVIYSKRCPFPFPVAIPLRMLGAKTGIYDISNLGFILYKMIRLSVHIS